ncbi:MAG: hypothetical protein IJE03_01410 [Ruminiclostridium sp.]|nr:hypothetical protein [Ruminiclostridium sp.]MBQ9852799.1 hypothetical protein [Ruminiclostridium sp.]
MTGKKGKREPLTPEEKGRMRRLVVCLVLFGVVFVGRGVDLEPVTQLSQRAAQLVRQDTEFQAVFAQVGRTIAQGEAWLKGMIPEGGDGENP